uniref:Uncharacterized protein n=1 Tax=viral metagenome TaxID=1070528 RepID=A0A6M3KEH6_9ZZZZ
MIPAILRVGTQPSYPYWVYSKKALQNYKIGDRIMFRPQLMHGASWESGIVREIKSDMLIVERF